MVLFWRYARTDVVRQSWKSCGTSMKIAKYKNSKPIFILNSFRWSMCENYNSFRELRNFEVYLLL